MRSEKCCHTFKYDPDVTEKYGSQSGFHFLIKDLLSIPINKYPFLLALCPVMEQIQAI